MPERNTNTPRNNHRGTLPDTPKVPPVAVLVLSPPPFPSSPLSSHYRAATIAGNPLGSCRCMVSRIIATFFHVEYTTNSSLVPPERLSTDRGDHDFGCFVRRKLMGWHPQDRVVDRTCFLGTTQPRCCLWSCFRTFSPFADPDPPTTSSWASNTCPHSHILKPSCFVLPARALVHAHPGFSHRPWLGRSGGAGASFRFFESWTASPAQHPEGVKGTEQLRQNQDTPAHKKRNNLHYFVPLLQKNALMTPTTSLSSTLAQSPSSIPVPPNSHLGSTHRMHSVHRRRPCRAQALDLEPALWYEFRNECQAQKPSPSK